MTAYRARSLIFGAAVAAGGYALLAAQAAACPIGLLCPTGQTCSVNSDCIVPGDLFNGGTADQIFNIFDGGGIGVFDDPVELEGVLSPNVLAGTFKGVLTTTISGRVTDRLAAADQSVALDDILDGLVDDFFLEFTSPFGAIQAVPVSQASQAGQAENITEGEFFKTFQEEAEIEFSIFFGQATRGAIRRVDALNATNPFLLTGIEEVIQ